MQIEVSKQACRKAQINGTRFGRFCGRKALLARIVWKEQDMKAREDLFAVQYLDLIFRYSSEEDLLKCEKMAQLDLEEIQQQIDELRRKLQKVEKQKTVCVVAKKSQYIASLSKNAVVGEDTTVADNELSSLFGRN